VHLVHLLLMDHLKNQTKKEEYVLVNFSSPEGELLQSRTTVVRRLLAAHVLQPLA
jgi:hypothetical protein